MTQGFRKLPEDLNQQMLELRAQGLTNPQIGKRMGVSAMTVYNRIGGQRKYKERAKEEMAGQA